MKLFLSIIVIILVLSFLPIPFKIKVYFSNDEIYIKLYRFTVLRKSFKNPNITNVKTETTEIKKTRVKKHNIISPLSIKGNLKLISLIDKIKFKPKIYIDGFLNYSLNDAAITAISYGAINSSLPILIRVINILFHIEKFNFPITPMFKDKLIYNSEINCIFTISIAKTIYITILIINNYIRIKGDELVRENI